MKRKTFLQATATALGGSLLPSLSFAEENRKRPIRFAHLTDIHVKPGIVPESGMAKALQHAQQMKPGLDFIINGGDSIMDALEADKTKTQTQWDLFKNILQKENSLPVYHTIGNHDIWGWFIKQNKPENDRLYGKQWAVEMLELKNRFYSFTKNNWHFIVLDSVQLNPAGGYIGKLDVEQLDWLLQELKNIPADKFICIVSHIPVLSICSGLFFDKTEANGDLLIKRNLMHTDFITLKKIFTKYPNIKACISGHIHLQDEVEYLGIKYYCNGAVSGNWWGGAFQEFEPAYAIVELYPDGTSKRTMIKYQ
ncbi:MAG: metallophosphoesterase [Sphingobacteriales bacterium]|nr:metallophosphoesterase [Sphingobacteriales bacterium]